MIGFFVNDFDAVKLQQFHSEINTTLRVVFVYLFSGINPYNKGFQRTTTNW